MGRQKPTQMPNPEEIMKYICFGYQNEKKWEQMSESEKNALFDVCFAYDDELRAKGHFLSGEAIEGASAAVSIRIKNGKVSVTERPLYRDEGAVGRCRNYRSEGPERGDCLVVQAPGHGLRRDGI